MTDVWLETELPSELPQMLRRNFLALGIGGLAWLAAGCGDSSSEQVEPTVTTQSSLTPTTPETSTPEVWQPLENLKPGDSIGSMVVQISGLAPDQEYPIESSLIEWPLRVGTDEPLSLNRGFGW